MAEKDNEYKVVVGNVGSVYKGTRKNDAMPIYWEYVELSKNSQGIYAGEPVTVYMNGDIVAEHQGKEE